MAMGAAAAIDAAEDQWESPGGLCAASYPARTATERHRRSVAARLASKGHPTGCRDSVPTDGASEALRVADAGLGSLEQIRVDLSVAFERDGVTFFALDVLPVARRPWRVTRRYRDFDVLAQQLGQRATTMTQAKLPRKHLLPCRGQRLEERRRGLETWLRCVLRHGLAKDGALWVPTLRHFLRAGCELPSDGSPGPAGDSLTGACAESDRRWLASGRHLLEFDIPGDVLPGDVLDVGVPDGSRIHFVVPEACAPGVRGEAWYDAAAGTMEWSREE